MSVLESPESPSSVDTPALHSDELEHAFRAWLRGRTKPNVLDLGQHRELSMVELSRQLEGSQATLVASEAGQLGLPPNVTIATAAAALLHATVDPRGPRCRSFRAASYYLRGLARLDADPLATTSNLGARIEGSTGERIHRLPGRVSAQALTTVGRAW